MPAGYGEQRVSVRLTGLQPNTSYYYRVLASNGEGQAEGEQVFATLTTLPSPSVMLDGRAWELVSPPEKDGSGVEPIAREGGLIQSSTSGEAVAYVANGPIEGEPVGNRAPEATQVLSARSPSGWSSQELVTPHEAGEGVEIGEAAEYRFFSSDLALSLVQPPDPRNDSLWKRRRWRPALAKRRCTCAPIHRCSHSEDPASRRLMPGPARTVAYLAPGYLPLVTPLMTGVKAGFGGHLEFLDATPDLSDVVFESEGVALLQGGAPGLYEWQASGGLQLVSVLPDGAPAFEPSLGYEGVNVRNAVVVADDGKGSRVVFSGEGEGGPGKAMNRPGCICATPIRTRRSS